MVVLWPPFLLALAFIALFLSWSSVGTELFWEERFSAYPKHRSTLQSASAAPKFDVVPQADVAESQFVAVA